MKDKRTILFTLWVFVLANYIYCDILSHMNPEFINTLVEGGQFPDLPPIDQKFLLWAGLFMEVPISMILLSRVLNYKANRIANIIAGSFMTIAQTGSLFIGTPELHYVFFSVIEITTTAFIAVYAWRWRMEENN